MSVAFETKIIKFAIMNISYFSFIPNVFVRIYLQILYRLVTLFISYIIYWSVLYYI